MSLFPNPASKARRRRLDIPLGMHFQAVGKIARTPQSCQLLAAWHHLRPGSVPCKGFERHTYPGDPVDPGDPGVD